MVRLKNALYLLRYAWKKCRLLFFTTSLKYILSALLPLTGIAGLGIVVGALESGKTAAETGRAIILYLSVSLAVSLGGTLVTYIDNRVMRMSSDTVQLDYMYDCVDINYHYVEDGSILDLKKKSMGAQPAWFLDSMFKPLLYVVRFAGVAYLFVTLSPWFILLIALTSVLSIALNFKKQRLDFDYSNAQTRDDRALEYLYRAMSDRKYAKDIRVFQGLDFLSEKYSSVLSRQLGALRALTRKKLGAELIITAVSALQTVLMYAFFSYQVSAGRLGIAEYTVLLSATALFTASLSGFFGCVGKLRDTLDYAGLFRDYKSKVAERSDIALGAHDSSPRIDRANPRLELSHVSFAYPGSDRAILRDISFSVEPGERIGIVGFNGSGKTTLIKLICRMYDPDEGVISVNGVDIRDIPLDEYTALLGVVLQDFRLFAYSIRENIGFDRVLSISDEAKIREAITKAGLSEKLEALPGGLDTVLYRTLDDGGVELSGGEGQKLALARAVYKDAAIMILDEPTSALDPLAEYDLFSRLSEISGGKTTLFISHRLSSTRFCDRILVLSDGKIAESGSHNELLRANGIYAAMFGAQAKYYEGTETDDEAE